MSKLNYKVFRTPHVRYRILFTNNESTAISGRSINLKTACQAKNVLFQHRYVLQ